MANRTPLSGLVFPRSRCAVPLVRSLSVACPSEDGKQPELTRGDGRRDRGLGGRRCSYRSGQCDRSAG
jgi:hypothetical protein